MPPRWFEGCEPCSVPGCSRRQKKEIPFCDRCWSMADDGERAMVQFALSAPFWRIRHGDPDYDPGDVVFDGAALPIKKWYGPVVEIPTSRGTMEPVSFTRVLQEYEARSTVRAVATAIHQRRHFQAHSGDFLEGEHDDA